MTSTNKKLNIGVFALVLLLVFATGSLALADILDDQQATGLYGIKILPPTTSLAELASYRAIRVYSYTSKPGDQVDIVQSDGVYSELVFENGVVRVKACKNVALWIEALVPLLKPTCSSGPAGLAGPEGKQGPAGCAGPAGCTGETGPSGPRGERGNQGERGCQGPEGRPGRDGRLYVYPVQQLVGSPFVKGMLTPPTPIVVQSNNREWWEVALGVVGQVASAYLGRTQIGDTILSATGNGGSSSSTATGGAGGSSSSTATGGQGGRGGNSTNTNLNYNSTQVAVYQSTYQSTYNRIVAEGGSASAASSAAASAAAAAAAAAQ